VKRQNVQTSKRQIVKDKMNVMWDSFSVAIAALADMIIITIEFVLTF
jgi:hypothetical protein